MTDKFTDEQLDYIDATLVSLGEPQAAIVLRAELTRPKPEFREGEVYAFRLSGDESWAIAVWAGRKASNEGVFRRPLDQTEVGPNWVPREAVEDLREAMEQILSGDNGHVPYNAAEIVAQNEQIAGGALSAFDKAVKP